MRYDPVQPSRNRSSSGVSLRALGGIAGFLSSTSKVQQL